MNKNYIPSVIIGLCLTGFSSLGMASVISNLSTSMTGDIRYSDINDLTVDVSIGYSGEIADWKVDLAPLNTSPLTYSGAKLQAFFFNLADGVNFSVTSINSGWAVVPATAQSEASGGAYFSYIGDNQGASDINTTNALEFTLDLDMAGLDGRPLYWVESMFTGADTETGAAGTGQLGAHIGGLPDNCSAFVMGYYNGDANSGTAPSDLKTCSSDVPEPSVIALFALGLFGLGFALRRQG